MQENNQQIEMIDEGSRIGSHNMRKCYSRAGETYRVPLSDVYIRFGFNFRLKPLWMSDEEWVEKEHEILRIEELALQILTCGQESPIEVDAVIDGEVIRLIVTEGYRRWLAFNYLVKNIGTHPEYAAILAEDTICYVEVKLNPKAFTEIDRMKRIITSQDNVKLRPMEIALGLLRIKEDGKKREDNPREYTNQEIAAMFGKSRQWADNMLILATLDLNTQIAIEKENITPTQAVADYRSAEKARKKEEKKEQQPKEPASDQNDNEEKKETSLGKAISNFLNDNNDDEDPPHGNEDNDDENPNAESDNKDASNGALDPFKPITYDKDSIHNQEEKASGPTDPKFREERPKNDRDDALPTVDFKKDKTEAELMLNGIKGTLDKIVIKMQKELPAHQVKHFVPDVERLIGFAIKDIDKVQEIIKKASDTR